LHLIANTSCVSSCLTEAMMYDLCCYNMCIICAHCFFVVLFCLSFLFLCLCYMGSFLKQTHWLTDWLTDRLIDWLTDWLIDLQLVILDSSTKMHMLTYLKFYCDSLNFVKLYEFTCVLWVLRVLYFHILIGSGFSLEWKGTIQIDCIIIVLLQIIVSTIK